jgi:uncharacterized RDD family membrane protein YckC
MKRPLLATLSGGALIVTFFGGGGAGTEISVVDGARTVQASSSVVGLIGAVVIVVAYIVALKPENPLVTGTLATTSRRAGAWILDFLFSLSALANVGALLPLVAEAVSTGRFHWQFQRSGITAADWIVSLLVLVLMLVGMAFYWTIPVVRGGQTIGQAILGLRVVAATTDPPSFGRVLARGFLQPLGPWLWLGKLISGKYWHDELGRTKVVQVSHSTSAAA